LREMLLFCEKCIQNWGHYLTENYANSRYSWKGSLFY
jgi:hypothetical protein